MRVDRVCEIQTGYTARGRLSSSPFGVPGLQLGDLNEHDDWSMIHPEQYDLGDVKERYFVGSGDVLFRSRGTTTTASAIPDDWPYLAVAILPLILLKPNKDLVLPEFLAWSLNQREAQTHFDRSVQGTSVRMVPRAALSDLELYVPDLKSQALILEAIRLAHQAYRLECKAADLRHHLNSLRLRDAVELASSKSIAGVRA